jgi:hypothetical protein
VCRRAFRSEQLRIAGALLICLLSGCSVDRGNATHHFGYVRIVDASDDRVVASKSVQTLGVRIGDGVGVGYFDEWRIAVPLDCRIVIVVRNQAQLDEALERLEDVPKGELCVAVKPS